MRKQFVAASTRYAALKACPWACSVFRVDGGYICFESATDAATYRKQR